MVQIPKYLYHATLGANTVKIITEGLKICSPRLWDLSCNDVIYASREAHESVWWVIGWYYEEYGRVIENSPTPCGFESRYVRNIRSAKFDRTPRIQEGISVFKIIRTGLKVTTGQYQDFKIHSDVEPSRFQYLFTVDPQDVIDMLFNTLTFRMGNSRKGDLSYIRDLITLKYLKGF